MHIINVVPVKVVVLKLFVDFSHGIHAILMKVSLKKNFFLIFRK